MKGLLIVILDVFSILGLTVFAYMQRHYYALGGEVILICGILSISLLLTSEKKQHKKQHRFWLKIES